MGVSKICFKSELKYENQIKDDDSGTSQSSTHIRKFFVDDGFDGALKDEKLFMEYGKLMQKEFSELEDIKEGEQVEVMVKYLPDGPIFNVFDGMTAAATLSKLFYRKGTEKVMASHPNLFKYMEKKMQEQLEDEETLNKPDEPS
mmetsp:Transcript_38725/g.58894  ORF Transcript_38725/g.58894 Transcript_38725/m.58894 type:complete len:144 (-) Transcript_38725:80-511(-)